ncbi:hypothetical protein [Haliangium sp. UPWRP_2]|uniref:hypothetical protein n=1 Tax=Haliangium sp. UPWRP_2 TaxID=1931276 RepID=UPI000B5458A3|nr:hypothetical protein [Haliangium sp. UPWRP_2]PSM31629.1 hypothetical protein BVG81_004450 [Haliangium sp. UPWRP_2]
MGRRCRSLVGLGLFALHLAGCAPPSRRAQISCVSWSADPRISQPLNIQIPPHSRSVMLVVRGDSDVLYGLASFQIGGRELQDLPPGVLADGLADSYFTAGTAQPPGLLRQFARLGTFTFLFPHASHQPPPEGRLSFRIAASRPGRPPIIDVITPPDDGARVLPLNLLFVSDRDRAELADPQAVLQQASAIFAAAGISPRLDSVQQLRGTEFSTLSSLPEPWEAPMGPLAALARLGQAQVHGPGLHVFVVDSLPTGRDGISLGLPGPPFPDSPFFGVILRHSEPATLGRTLAHEVAHFLGLRHVRTATPSGAVLDDGLDDTEPDGKNLMEHGHNLSPSQIDLLLRSPLLLPR